MSDFYFVLESLKVISVQWDFEGHTVNKASLQAEIILDRATELENSKFSYPCTFYARLNGEELFKTKILLVFRLAGLSHSEVFGREESQNIVNSAATEIVLGHARTLLTMASGMAGFDATLLVPTLVESNQRDAYDKNPYRM